MIFARTAGAVACFLGCTALTPVHAAEWEVSIGGYMEQYFGYSASDPAATLDTGTTDADSDNEFRFRRSITLDNGLTFEPRVDLGGDASSVDEPDVAISGSFGSVLIGEEDTYFRVPSVGGFDPCGGSDTGQARYFTPRFAGFSLGAGYTTEGNRARSRGGLATENGGNVVNPGVTFEYDLSGPTVGLGASFCLNTGQALPANLGFSLTGSTLRGSDWIDNRPFVNGLGVTGVGEFPGVFVATPTDIQFGEFRVQRHSTEARLAFSQALAMAYSGASNPEARSGPFGWRAGNPSLSTVSVLGGLRLGAFDQQENTYYEIDSPAFGINSPWQAAYDTDFDSTHYGAYVGLSNARTFFLTNGSTETFRISGTVGYTVYDIDVDDRVSATGLGGALNYNSNKSHSFSEGQFETGLSASYTYARDTSSISFFAGVDYGASPYLDYRRPDSTLTTTLDPTLSLEARTTYTIGFNWQLRF